MKTIDWVKEHYDELEKDNWFDRRWTKRFLDFLPWKEWKEYGFNTTENFNAEEYTPKDWTEQNILEQLEEDVRFGYQKAVDGRGISSELMADVVDTWCKILENGLNLNGDDGYYHIRQFEVVAEHYGWEL